MKNYFDTHALVREYFVKKNHYFDDQNLKWMLLSKVQLHDAILHTNLKFSFVDLDNPLNCLFVSKLYKTKRNLYIYVYSIINFLSLFLQLLSYSNLRFVFFCLQKRSSVNDLIRYLLLVRLLKKYHGVQEEFINKPDDLNMPLAQRFFIAKSMQCDDMVPSIHGGGFYIYRGLPFDTFEWKSNQIELRSDFFKGMPYFDETALWDNIPLSVALAPYWFHMQGGNFMSQDFLSVHEQVSFLAELQNFYGENNVLIRDPSRVSTFFKSSVIGESKIDSAKKDQRSYTTGAVWSKDFLNADLKITTAFFSLGLQLLFSKHPAIIYVTRSSFYAEYLPDVDNLISIGVFVTKLSDVRHFNDRKELRNWWDSSEQIRKKFLERYFDEIAKISRCELVVR